MLIIISIFAAFHCKMMLISLIFFDYFSKYGAAGGAAYFDASWCRSWCRKLRFLMSHFFVVFALRRYAFTFSSRLSIFFRSRCRRLRSRWFLLHYATLISAIAVVIVGDGLSSMFAAFFFVRFHFIIFSFFDYFDYKIFRYFSRFWLLRWGDFSLRNEGKWLISGFFRFYFDADFQHLSDVFRLFQMM